MEVRRFFSLILKFGRKEGREEKRRIELLLGKFFVIIG